MTERQQTLVRAVLKSLYEIDGQVNETVLHATVSLHVRPSALLSEFDEAIRFCEAQRWILGIRNKLAGVKWSITDQGKAAYLEMQ